MANFSYTLSRLGNFGASIARKSGTNPIAYPNFTRRWFQVGGTSPQDAANAAKRGMKEALRKGEHLKNQATHEAEHMADSMKESAQNAAEKAKQAAQEVWESAKETAQKTKDTVLGKGSETKDTASRSINSKDHP